MDDGIRTTTVGDLAVVVVSGELDVHSAAPLREALLRLIDADGADVLVDLTETTFVDSTAMGVLVAALRRLTPLGRRLELAVADERVLRVLRIAGLSRAFVIHRTAPRSPGRWSDEVLQAADRSGGEAPQRAPGRDGDGRRD